jgi:hypothetical protein
MWIVLWAEAYGREIMIDGDRPAVRMLATILERGEAVELGLDAPPLGRPLLGEPLRTVSVRPRDESETRVSFRRDGDALVVSGAPAEIARLVGGNIATLADSPTTTNSVRTHIHLDPTNDPDHRFWAADSLPLVVGFSAE